MNSEKQKTKSFKTLKVVSHYALIFFSLSLLVFSFSLLTSAQSRDYLTEAEIELIRDTQQIDQRVGLLTQIIDRRFMLLKIDVSGRQIFISKESDKWGEPPTGTRTELLADIKQILQKAIDDIDNLSSRPDSMVIDPNEKSKKPKGFSDLFPKAVRKLAAAAARYKAPLNATLETTKDEREKGILMDSIEMCEDIIASVSKLK